MLCFPTFCNRHYDVLSIRGVTVSANSLGCSLSLGFHILSHSDHKYFNKNKEINLFSTRVEPTTTQSQGNLHNQIQPNHVCDNS